MSVLSFFLGLVCFGLSNLLFVIIDVIRVKYDGLLSDYNKKKIIKNIYKRCKSKWARDSFIRSSYNTFENYCNSEIYKKFEYEKYIDYYIWGTKIGGQEEKN